MKSLSVSEMMFPWKPCHQRRAVIVLTHWSQGNRYGCILSWKAWSSGSLGLGSDILWLEFSLRLVIAVNCRAFYFIRVLPSCFKNQWEYLDHFLLFKPFLCTIIFFFFSNGASHGQIHFLCNVGAAACVEAAFRVSLLGRPGRAGPVQRPSPPQCRAGTRVCRESAVSPCSWSMVLLAPHSWNCWGGRDSFLDSFDL